VLAGFCRIVSVIPDERVANAATALPTVGRGERLVYAFELFQGLVPHTRISLDQLVLLVVSLAEGIEWDIETCARCAALIVVDRLSVEEGACEDCQRSGERRRAWVSEDSMTQEDNLADSEEESCAAEQLDLFMDSKESDDSS
jgi:recombinational DNA repair protein (RecF pathway)